MLTAIKKDWKWILLVLPFLFAAGIAIAEIDDAPFTVGVGRVTPIGAMLDDTTPDTVNEGDIGIPRMSSSRVLLTETTSAAGLGLDKADDAGFTAATSLVRPIGLMFDDTTPDSVDENDAGIPRMSANRNQYVTIRDAAGNERGANVDASNQMSVVDSAVKTAVEIMDDWDSSDHAKTKNVPLTWDSDNAANCAAITAASAQLTLDTDSDHFRCCAWGNSAYALTGANPTATTTVTTGFSFIIADGQCHDLTTADAKIAVIGTAAVGNYCCISLEAP